MLTDIGPSAGSQFYGPQMVTNLASIPSHIEKPNASISMSVSVEIII